MTVNGLAFGYAGNEGCGYWLSGTDCYVDMEYVCNKEIGKNIELAIGIRKMDQSPLYYLGTKVVQHDLDQLTGKGYSRCIIPRLPIEPGTYLVNAEIKRSGVIADAVIDAALINVEGGDFYGTGIVWPYGGALCEYKWIHQRKEVMSELGGFRPINQGEFN